LPFSSAKVLSQQDAITLQRAEFFLTDETLQYLSNIYTIKKTTQWSHVNKPFPALYETEHGGIMFLLNFGAHFPD
jgi:hypothetical protein